MSSGDLEDASLAGIDESLQRFKALSDALDERLRQRQQQQLEEPPLYRPQKRASFIDDAGERQWSPPKHAGGVTFKAQGAFSGPAAPRVDQHEAVLSASMPLPGGAAGHDPASQATLAAIKAAVADAKVQLQQLQEQQQPQPASHPAAAGVRFAALPGPPSRLQNGRASGAPAPVVAWAPQGAGKPATASTVPALAQQRNSPSISLPSAGGAVAPIAGRTSAPGARAAATASPQPAQAAVPARVVTSAGGADTGGGAAMLGQTWPRAAGGSTAAASARPPDPVLERAAAVIGAAGGAVVVAGRAQYKQLLSAAQTAGGNARGQAFQREMAAIDAEIDDYVSAHKFEQSAPDAALAMQTAWRAARVRVFFNRYMAVRAKHLRAQMALAFAPLKQLVLAKLHARRRMVRVAFREWRDWVALTDELFLKLVTRLRSSIGSVKQHATPQQLWQLCVAPGDEPWLARLTLGTLVANILRRQMPQRTARLYLRVWRRVVRLQTQRRQAAGEVLRRLDANRFQELVRLLFRFWFRWAVVRISERLRMPPPIFRPRIPEWDAWLFKHSRTRELEGRIVLLHRGFRLRYCFGFWLFFMRRNRRMRTAWVASAAQQIELILRSALNAFKANAAEARRTKRLKRAAFLSWLNATQRNIAVRNIAKQVNEISVSARKRQAMRKLHEWARIGQLLATAASLQIMSRRGLCLVPAYALVGDAVHLWFQLAWNHWKEYTLGRLRMRCLLGAHLARDPKRVMEAAFKALRKWAEMCREERAAAALAERARRMRAAAGLAPVPGAPGADLSSDPSLDPFSDPSALSGLGYASFSGGVGEALGPLVGPWELFVSMADYPMEGGVWRPRWGRADIMAQQPQTMNPGGVSSMPAGHMERMVKDLEELDGQFMQVPGERATRLLVTKHQEVTPLMHQWIDPRQPISAIYTSSPYPDPVLWQRIVGMLACGVPPPEHPGLPLIDEQRMPLIEAVTAIRRAVQRARFAPDVGAGDLAAQLQRAPPLPASPDGSPAPAARRISGHGLELELLRRRTRLVEAIHGGQDEEDRAAAVSEGIAALEAQQAALAAGRRPGVLLSPEQQDVMLLHRVCEAEEYLDTLLHLLLQVSGSETSALRSAVKARAIEAAAAGRASASSIGSEAGGAAAGSTVSGGSAITGSGGSVLLGDALVTLLRHALDADLATVAAELQHRTNRDRVITLGMDLREKARSYAAHRPEFTLTMPHSAESRERGGQGQAQGGRVMGRADHSRQGGQRGLQVLGSVVVPSSTPPGSAGAQGGGPQGQGQQPDGRYRSGDGEGDKEEEEEEEEDQEDRRALRALLRQQQAEAAAAESEDATAKAAQQRAAAASAMSPNWKQVRAASMSKSALIRMEMAVGMSRTGSPVPGTPPGSVSQWRGSGPGAVPQSPAGSSISPPKGGGARGSGKLLQFDESVNRRAAGAHVALAAAEAGWMSGLRSSGPPRSAAPRRAQPSMPAAAAASTPPPQSPSAAEEAGDDDAAAQQHKMGSPDARRKASALPRSSGGPQLSRARSMKRMASLSVSTRHAADDDEPAPGTPTTPSAAGHGLSPPGSAVLTDRGTPSSAADKPASAQPEAPPPPPPPANVFVYLVPPKMLTVGQVFSPDLFPWPADIPGPDLIQGKADYVLRSALPALAPPPPLPDIIFTYLGNPGSRSTAGASPPTLPGGPSPEASRHSSQLPAASGSQAGSGGGPGSSHNPSPESSALRLAEGSARSVGRDGGGAPGTLDDENDGPMSGRDISLSQGGAAGARAAEPDAEAVAALRARLHARTMRRLQDLGVEQEGEEGAAGEQQASARVAVGELLQGAAGGPARGAGANSSRSPSRTEGREEFVGLFGGYGLQRTDREGDIGEDKQARYKPARAKTGGGSSGRSSPAPGAAAVGKAPKGVASAKGKDNNNKAQQRSHAFHVTQHELNVFMGGHMRKAITAVAAGLDERATSPGRAAAAGSPTVTPGGVVITREGEEGAEGAAVAEGGGASGAAAIVRRTNTVIVREARVEQAPFEEMFDFHKSVWLPPERRVRMLDDYDLLAELASGRAGQLDLSQPFGFGALGPPRDSPFLLEFEEELERTRAGRDSRGSMGNKSMAGGRNNNGRLRSATSRCSSRNSPRRTSRYQRYLGKDDFYDVEDDDGAWVPSGTLSHESSFWGNAAASAAAAAAVAAVGEAPAVLQLLGMPAGSLRGSGAVSTGGPFSPWGLGGSGSGAGAAGNSPPRARHGSISPSRLSRETSLAVRAGADGRRLPHPHHLPAHLEQQGEGLDSSAPPSEAGDGAPGGAAAAGRLWQSLEPGAEAGPGAEEADAAMGSMFAQQQWDQQRVGVASPKKAKAEEPLTHISRARKRGNLRTGLQLLADPLLTAQQSSDAPSASASVASVAAPAATAEAEQQQQQQLRLDGEGMLLDDAALLASAGPEVAAAAAAAEAAAAAAAEAAAAATASPELSAEATLGDSPFVTGSTAARLVQEAEVQKQLEALRSMWSSQPYSQPSGAPGNGGSGAASGAIARLLAEAEAEEEAACEAAAERMAQEFAGALLHKDVGSGSRGSGQQGDAAAAGRNPDPNVTVVDRPGSVSPRRAGSATAGGSRGRPAGLSPLLVDGAMPSDGRASSAGRAQDGGPSSNRSGKPPVQRPVFGPAQRHPMRELLDSLGESMAPSLDPAALTGLNLPRYPKQLAQLMQRLMVAPTATRHLFMQKVQSVQQIRQRLLEDRALAEQLQRIAYANEFNPFTMAPGGTDPVSGLSGPFAEAQLAAAAQQRERRQQQKELQQRLAERLAAQEAAGLAHLHLPGSASQLNALLLPAGQGSAGAAPAPADSAGSLEQPPGAQHARASGHGHLVSGRAPWASLDAPVPPAAAAHTPEAQQYLEQLELYEQYQQQRQQLHHHQQQQRPEHFIRPVRLQEKPAHVTPTIVVPKPKVKPKPDARKLSTAITQKRVADLLAGIPNTTDIVLLDADVSVGEMYYNTGLQQEQQLKNKKKKGKKGKQGGGDEGGEGAEGGPAAEQKQHGGESKAEAAARPDNAPGTAAPPDAHRAGDEAGTGAGDAAGGVAAGEEGAGIEQAGVGEQASEPAPVEEGGSDSENDSDAEEDEEEEEDEDEEGDRASAQDEHTAEEGGGEAQERAEQPAEGGVQGEAPEEPAAGQIPAGVLAAAAAAAVPSSAEGFDPPTAPSSMPPSVEDGFGGDDGDAEDGGGDPSAGWSLTATGNPAQQQRWDTARVQDQQQQEEGEEGAWARGGDEYPGGGGERPASVSESQRPKLNPKKLQVALARRAALRAALEARGELLELDDMDLEELEEEAELVDRLVEASIRVYSDMLARRHRALIPGSDTWMPGRGRLHGWAPPPAAPPPPGAVNPTGAQQLVVRRGRAPLGAPRGAGGMAEDSQAHLGSPRSQLRPVGLPPHGVVGAVVGPNVYPAARVQQGSVTLSTGAVAAPALRTTTISAAPGGPSAAALSSGGMQPARSPPQALGYVAARAALAAPGSLAPLTSAGRASAAAGGAPRPMSGHQAQAAVMHARPELLPPMDNAPKPPPAPSLRSSLEGPIPPRHTLEPLPNAPQPPSRPGSGASAAGGSLAGALQGGVGAGQDAALADGAAGGLSEPWAHDRGSVHSAGSARLGSMSRGSSAGSDVGGLLDPSAAAGLPQLAEPDTPAHDDAATPQGGVSPWGTDVPAVAPALAPSLDAEASGNSSMQLQPAAVAAAKQTQRAVPSLKRLLNAGGLPPPSPGNSGRVPW